MMKSKHFISLKKGSSRKDDPFFVGRWPVFIVLLNGSIDLL